MPRANAAAQQAALPDPQTCLRRTEDAVLHGPAVARILLNLQWKGWRPGAILAQHGWAETLYAKAVFPSDRRVGHCKCMRGCTRRSWVQILWLTTQGCEAGVQSIAEGGCRNPRRVAAPIEFDSLREYIPTD
ncbi:hypothetical protein I7X39_01395 [Inhella sp. 1Y17]|uniref:Glycosyl transferase family 4 domain-containing protein n=1 Tax=Inhella proteolytica TaxID=2795029 RepID=A0A931J0S7_9BURK|nr:hypothetical protein [Inhella proteolytica]